MANSKSALKRVQIAERNRQRNKSYKSEIKTLSKKFFTAVDEYNSSPSPEIMEKAQKLMSATYSKIDKAVKRNVLHSNNGARKKSRLARYIKQAAPGS